MNNEGYVAQLNVATSSGGHLPLRFIFAPDFQALVDELSIYYYLTLGYSGADEMYHRYRGLSLVESGEVELNSQILITIFRAGRTGDLSDFIIDEYLMGGMNDMFDESYVQLLNDVMEDLIPITNLD